MALQADGSVVAWGKNMDGQTNVPPSLGPCVAIAAGGSHSLALQEDGTVVAWGRNWDGQTNVPPFLTNVVAIAAGAAHSLALSQDGSITVWGGNEYGQTNLPVRATNIFAIASSYYHSLALRTDRTVVSWGSQFSVPPFVTNVVAIAAGWEHSLALRGDGSLVAWGDNSYGQCNVPLDVTNVVFISAGYGYSAAKRADGMIFVWGTGSYGLTNVPVGLRNVVSLASGENHIVGLVESGPVRITTQPRSAEAHVAGAVRFHATTRGSEPFWGQWHHNSVPVSGATSSELELIGLQLENAGSYVFVVTNSFSGTQSESASLEVREGPAIEPYLINHRQLPGEPFRLAARTSGSPPLSFQWRHKDVNLTDGPRITGSQTATLEINSAENSDAGDYTLVVTNSFGSVTGWIAQVVVTPVIGWGANGSGQLDVPVDAINIVAVSAGEDHSLALRADGSVLAWGDNSFGQTMVPAASSNAVAVSAGGRHSLALLSSGRVIAWGDNSRGQTNVPMHLTNVTAIAAGEAHSVALRRDGTVRAWGDSSNLQTNPPLTLSNVIAVVAGDRFSGALQADGTLILWGGFSSTNQITAADAGGRHQVALRFDGSVIAWGRNYYDQTSVPPAATNVVALSAGGDHGLALRADGHVVAWGANYYGQTDASLHATNLIAVSAGGAHSLALQKQTGLPGASAQPPQFVELGKSTLLLGGTQPGTIGSYQWRLNGKDLAGATNAALLLSNVHWTNTGSYQIAVSNAMGTSVGPAVIVTALRTPLVFESSGVSNFDGTNLFFARLRGASGVGPVVVYSSSNRVDWVPVLTNSAVMGTIDFSDPEAANDPERYYRAAELTLAPSVFIEISKSESTSSVPSVELKVNGLSAAGPTTIYASTNLNEWTAIFTNPPTIGPLEYLDRASPGQSLRYYRASEAR
jgi:alpha-tubulin suppressor-like RCC1 family protein